MIVFVGCKDGGVEIEETAKTNPELILRHEVSAGELANLDPASLKDFGAKLFDDPKQAEETAVIMAKMGKLFSEKDASLIEINPLIADGEGKVVALDAKMMIDDNAMFRHSELEELRDMDSEDQDELDAHDQGLSFIRLEGNIGCMVNGAGLAMATMDTIKHFGGRPGEFFGCGRQLGSEESCGGLQAHSEGPEHRGDSREHFRRHHALRRYRQGIGRIDEYDGHLGAAGGAACGHERERRPGDSRGHEAQWRRIA